MLSEAREGLTISTILVKVGIGGATATRITDVAGASRVWTLNILKKRTVGQHSSNPSMRIICALILSLLFMTGCAGSPPSRFYLLDSLSGTSMQERGFAPWQGAAVGIGPVQLPDYLDRPQIVVRNTRNELQLAEFDKWAEPLEKNFARVLAENLSVLLGTDRVVLFPWPKSVEVCCQIALDVTQFEGISGGKIALNARWTILGDSGKRVIMMRQSRIVESVDGSGYEALVSAQSRTLAALSREISAAVVTLPEVQKR